MENSLVVLHHETLFHVTCLLQEKHVYINILILSLYKLCNCMLHFNLEIYDQVINGGTCYFIHIFVIFCASNPLYVNK